MVPPSDAVGPRTARLHHPKTSQQGKGGCARVRAGRE